MFCVLATWRRHQASLKKGILSNSLKPSLCKIQKSYVCFQKSMRKTEDRQSKGWAGFLTSSLVQENIQRPILHSVEDHLAVRKQGQFPREPWFLCQSNKEVRKSTAKIDRSTLLPQHERPSLISRYLCPSYIHSHPCPSQLSTSIQDMGQKHLITNWKDLPASPCPQSCSRLVFDVRINSI